MDVSGASSGKERQVRAKKASKDFQASSSIPSPKSGVQGGRSASQAVMRKVKVPVQPRKEESVDSKAEEEPKMKKRRNEGAAPSSWKRVKLAEDIQFKEGGFFMLEELHFDPNDANSDYNQLMYQIPKNPANLEFEPTIDTNDSDLEDILGSDDDAEASKGAKSAQLSKKAKKTAQNISDSPAATSGSITVSSSSTKEKKEVVSQETIETAKKSKAAEKRAKKTSQPSIASPASASSSMELSSSSPNETTSTPSQEASDSTKKSKASDKKDISGETTEKVILEEDEGGDDAVIDALDEDEEQEGDDSVNKLRSRHVFVPEEELEFVDLPEWLATYNLHKRILMALKEMGYTEPTPIQKAVMPVALGKRLDIVGASQTGSGKTLAFGIPVIHQILELQEKAHRLGAARDDSLKCLILSPTRELALQIVTHLEKITKHAYVKVVPVIGGISVTKQMRFLRKRPDVLVATPGRLWELISSGLFEESGQTLASLRWLIFDEADKMIEFGRFAELSNILRTVYNSRQRSPSSTSADDPLSNFSMDVDDPTSSNSREISRKSGKNSSGSVKLIQTFIFSATMMIGEESRKNLKKVKNTVEKMKDKMRKERLERQKKRRGKEASGKGELSEASDSMMEKLMEQIEFQREIEVVDIVKGEHKVANLEEAKICCLHEEKDYYLYYFLSKYGGKSIIFVNAISNIKRLLPLMVILRLNAFGMHANMEQHHRMKNLEKFVASERGVLITTDVMSRGVDIPSVDHVIHYSIPTSAEIFIHRSGRTARAFASGLSLHIVEPEDRQRYNAIMQQIGSKSASQSQAESDMPFEVPDFPISDYQLFNACKKRVKLAAELDSLSHEKQKKSADKQWLEQKAKDLDADIPDDLLSSDDDRKTVNDARVKQKAYDNAKTKAKYAHIKAQLRELLAKPLSYVAPSTTPQSASMQVDEENSTDGPSSSKASGSEKAETSIRGPSHVSKPVVIRPISSASNNPKLLSLASSAYPTKMAGARLLFAKNSPSFQSPPKVDETGGKKKNKRGSAKKNAKDGKGNAQSEKTVQDASVGDLNKDSPSQSEANSTKTTVMQVDDEAMPGLVADLTTHSFTVKKAPSAAFLEVQKHKGTKEAHRSSEMIRKHKEMRKLRMAAMGRQSVSGPMRKK